MSAIAIMTCNYSEIAAPFEAELDLPSRRAVQHRLQMPESITILGDGAMATVCSILLSTSGHRVTMWGAFEQSIERLLQDRENRRLLPGVKVPNGVRLTANDSECLAGATM